MLRCATWMRTADVEVAVVFVGALGLEALARRTHRQAAHAVPTVPTPRPQTQCRDRVEAAMEWNGTQMKIGSDRIGLGTAAPTRDSG